MKDTIRLPKTKEPFSLYIDFSDSYTIEMMLRLIFHRKTMISNND